MFVSSILFFLSFLKAHILFPLTLRLLVDTVVHFPPSLEEVTVSVSDERMWVRNHVEEEGEFVVCFFHRILQIQISLISHWLLK